MKLVIDYCNNIEHGELSIEENKLNIKYAINGTGKSTVARALALLAESPGSATALNSLTPFKYRQDGGKLPSISGVDFGGPVKIFDEAYINSFVFRQDELLKDSFEIFVRSADYDQGIAEIEQHTEAMKSYLSKDPEIDELIKHFSEISASFGKPTKSGIHGSSDIAKALKDGNKVENIPEGLEAYAPYIRHQSGFKWIKWQQDGAAYLDVGQSCPYCTNDIEQHRETIKKVSTAYDAKSIEILNRVVGTFDRLSRYFTADTKSVISNFVRNVGKYSDEQIAFLHEVKAQIDNLTLRINTCRNLSFSSLKDVSKIIEALESYKIDLALYNHLQSADTEAKVHIINSALDVLVAKASVLQGAVVRQKRLVEKVVGAYSKQIDEFLRNAGYKYGVELREDSSGKHKLLLVHSDAKLMPVENVKNHLSYGERNAIALVLFMFDAVKSGAALTVLDDPISSFDKNKKYAILDMLFRRSNSLAGKTVLLMTHDLDPVVDMMVHHTDRFDPPSAYFLENKNGLLEEKVIDKQCVKTFIEINRVNASLQIPALHRLVYVRRLKEVANDKGGAFDLISNIFHKRRVPTKHCTNGVREMTAEEIAIGTAEIKADIPDFSYDELYGLVTDDQSMRQLYRATRSNYEKLHLYRIMFDDKKIGDHSPVILKFINEAFHIENNYIYQLNPRDFQLVPQFVIDECDKYVN